MTTSYPPIHHHSSTRISTSTALAYLSAYLEAANTDPSLHPNALLTENGPTTPSSGPNTGLVLHNLKRVEAGLKGEHLGADLTFKKYGGEGLPDMMVEDAVAGANEIPTGGQDVRDKDLEGQWQDKEEFEREQDIVEGEVGKRDNAVDGGFEDEGGHVPKVKSTKSRVEKLDRKKLKKERRKKDRITKMTREKSEER